MLIALILAALWILGVTYSYTLGGYIHVLLLAAVVSLVVWFLQGRRAATTLKR